MVFRLIGCQGMKGLIDYNGTLSLHGLIKCFKLEMNFILLQKVDRQTGCTVLVEIAILHVCEEHYYIMMPLVILLVR